MSRVNGCRCRGIRTRQGRTRERSLLQRFSLLHTVCLMATSRTKHVPAASRLILTACRSSRKGQAANSAGSRKVLCRFSSSNFSCRQRALAVPSELEVCCEATFICYAAHIREEEACASPNKVVGEWHCPFLLIFRWQAISSLSAHDVWGPIYLQQFTTMRLRDAFVEDLV